MGLISTLFAPDFVRQLQHVARRQLNSAFQRKTTCLTFFAFFAGRRDLSSDHDI